jgi:hypothetical protein
VRIASALVAIIAAVLLPVRLLPGEVICDKELRLKPLRCVCGRLINLTGGPGSHVIVTVLKDAPGEQMQTRAGIFLDTHGLESCCSRVVKQ